MSNSPFFPVSTPQAFYELLRASGSKEAERTAGFWMGFIRSLPSSAIGPRVHLGLAVTQRNGSTASTASSLPIVPGTDHLVRWSPLPAAQPVTLSPDELAKRGPDFLEQEIAQRVANAPQRWTMVVTVGSPGDPTADPSEAWPGGIAEQLKSGRSSRSTSRPSGTAHAVISISIPLSCHPACGRPMTRFPQHARPLTQSHTTCARRRPRIIPGP